ncbi:LPS export ABC transporter periplasmic protein LptC [Synechocystis sp. LKSZ1]|uniref:LPS export ABC transporter periplasmic protein LptC n=1 Tax=Synechocystis sp. LKSZ1 TaxID=3144951 RepID=UPI00336BE638
MSTIFSNLSRLTLGGLVLLALVACQPPDPLVKPSPSNSPQLKSQLTLTNATLEQSNAKGQTLWKIQVKDTQYTPDRKNAKLTQLKGDLYSNGKVVLKVKADRGEILENGAVILLRDNIVAVDPRNQAVLRSQEVEWQPQAALLIARRDLQGEHPQVRLTAQEGRYATQGQQLTLKGNIVAVSDQRRLELKTEELVWEVPQNKLIGERPLNIARYEGKTITDKITAAKAEVLLKTKQVLVKDNTEFRSLKPPLQIAVKSLVWNYADRLVESQEPVQILDYQAQMTVTGNRGRVDLAQEMAWLTDGTKGTSEEHQSQLFADRLTWNMRAQTLEAVGNVIYEQNRGTKFNLTGDKALGSLSNNTVVVTSYNPDRVVTEIYPSPR